MKRPQVALLIETSNAYARGLLEGVTAYLRERRGWSIYLSEHGRGDSVPAWLHGWKGDGIIARIENRRIARAVEERGLPTVDLSAARLSLDHLRERGFRNVGYCGLSDYNWSLWRCEHFERLSKEAGFDCRIHMTRHRGDRAADWAAEQRELAAWVRSLPKPVGVFTCYDIRGRQLLEACRSENLRVPDDVAVIGVDNDLLLCELADPPLSSVIPDTRRTGYLAAQLLGKMMAGKKVAPVAHLVEPLGIATRRSTDVLAIDDKDISAAVHYIRDHACDGISVGQVLEVVPLSRRTLETRFRNLIGRTPHEEIVRVQVERAKELLRDTDLPLKAIAERAGVRYAEYLCVLFKRVMKTSPGAYRKTHRTSGAL